MGKVLLSSWLVTNVWQRFTWDVRWPLSVKIMPVNQIMLHMHIYKTNTGARAFPSCAPSLWNNLALSVCSVISDATFKKHLKTHLFDLAFPFNHQHTWQLIDAIEMFHQFSYWTLIWLSRHPVWLHQGYWRYRNLIDWLIDSKNWLEPKAFIENMRNDWGHSNGYYLTMLINNFKNPKQSAPINQSHFYSTNIPSVARLSGSRAISVFKREVDKAIL